MRATFITFLVLALTSPAFSQLDELISINLSKAPFDELVDRIEQQTPYHFYFRKDDVDSVQVTMNVSGQPTRVILKQALEGYNLYFAAYQKNVYVTKERPIYPQLAPDFFNQSQQSEAIAFDYSGFEEKSEQKAAEEKIFSIGTPTGDMKGEAVLSGKILDRKSGETIIGATIQIENSSQGAATDAFGNFSFPMSKGRHTLVIKSLGMKDTRRQVMVYGNGKLDVELEENITPLKEIFIHSERDAQVTGLQMGVQKLDIKTMKQIPLGLGETDILKVITTLPGVQTVGEGTLGYNVRGGSASQNLILFNDAVIYNPSHLFGFFSTFNPDVIKDVSLYTSGVTADYGGRLASVLDVNAREGNLKKFSASGGISPVTGRLTLEGPIKKEKSSFLIGLRSTYSDWLLHQVQSKKFQNSSASYYDMAATFHQQINENNSLDISGYLSSDQFQLNNDTAYQYTNKTASIKWTHKFSSKLLGYVTGAYSGYGYSIFSDANPINSFNMDFSIQQTNVKADFSYFLNPKHTLTAGLTTTSYQLSPGNLQPKGSESLIKPNVLNHEKGLESAIYFGENYEVGPRVSVYAGIRYSTYQNLGPNQVFQYADGKPRTETSIIDTLNYPSGKKIANYGGLEPRFSVRYLLPNNSSVKFSYNRMRQYIQSLYNSTAITPTAIWKLSDTYIKPQVGDQISVGYYHNFKGNLIETSVEAYYKTMKNTVDYKGGAELLLNHHLETDILNAKGKAYGIELLIKKSYGKANGWISYTYSRSFLQTRSAFTQESVNQGVYYRSPYDKPHAFNFIGNYKINRRFNMSLNAIYSTGRPITLPLAKYTLEGANRVYYSERNKYRIPDYFRIDFSINVEGNHKIRKLAHSSWTFAVYNLLGRHNAYSVYFTSQDGVIRGYKLSIFARPIPTITYNFRF